MDMGSNKLWELVMSSDHLILWHSLLLLLSVFPSITVFSKKSALRIRWSKYWSFSFSISLYNESSRLISFGTNWFDLLAVLGTLKSLLQHHSSKASVLPGSAFFMVNIRWVINVYQMYAESLKGRVYQIPLLYTWDTDLNKKKLWWNHATTSHALRQNKSIALRAVLALHFLPLQKSLTLSLLAWINT